VSKEIIIGINELKELLLPLSSPKTWEFEVKRNSFSQYIESVKATQK
jgi:hypothetical protein